MQYMITGATQAWRLDLEDARFLNLPIHNAVTLSLGSGGKEAGGGRLPASLANWAGNQQGQREQAKLAFSIMQLFV